MNLKLLSIALTNTFIDVKNMDKPVCKDCKYFKYDSLYTDYNYGKCTRFSHKNLISGKIVFENVVTARHTFCGENGTAYEQVRHPM
jgi:hypothetical protein